MIFREAPSLLTVWDIGAVTRRASLVIVLLIIAAAAYTTKAHSARPRGVSTVPVAANVGSKVVMGDDSHTPLATAAVLPSGARPTNVYYSCPACLGEHPLTMMQTDSRAGFEAMSFKNNIEQCPTTGLSVVLNKSQLLWKDEAGNRR
jgi:hypothetical protein